MDTKGRISLPSKFKSKMGKKVFITRGLDNCLSVYTKESWKGITEKLNTLSLSKSSDRGFNRFMLSGAVEVDVDKQGRILVPEFLREFAALDKKVVWTGVGDRAEIWDQSRWQKYLSENTKDPESLAESLNGVI